MSIEDKGLSRRRFLKSAAIASGVAVGVFAFPSGLTQVVQAVAPGVSRITRT